MRTSSVDRTAADAFLVDHDAASIVHPGGTLLAHLRRTADLLDAWDAPDELVLAGLCHAAYGTDGFAAALIPETDRPTLATIIGDGPEEIVHLYASCDRKHLYAQLGTTAPPAHRNRFTGELRPLSPAEVLSFCELTIANELDLVRISPAFAAEHGAAITALFENWQPLVSPVAWRAYRGLLG